MKILAISGSLREASTNTAILKSLQKLAPGTTDFTIYCPDPAIPHFSPDLDKPDAFTSVETLRNLVKNANGVIICTPEYAYGVPGTLKNALDWLVSSGELNEKPVAALSASPMYTGGEKALTSLLHTLTALGTVPAGSLSIGSINTKINAAKEITDSETVEALKMLLQKLEKVVAEKVSG
ncbi:NADPH-dependent FMN reductase [Adhaeribacter soli]|uniref:NAD(P)H-dependent oxidoreductase n=1 Tax=Adhaeribacter soli TaxID=2607655 RepID=A0A5N1J112_9BACT|nr:NADPH-dependent FMN reductase [Adhaeribacter soli]KAA9340181.1 NAD(P)H-dependent oxidoreductase [Adhaeribacter soli]